MVCRTARRRRLHGSVQRRGRGSEMLQSVRSGELAMVRPLRLSYFSSARDSLQTGIGLRTSASAKVFIPRHVSDIWAVLRWPSDVLSCPGHVNFVMVAAVTAIEKCIREHLVAAVASLEGGTSDRTEAATFVATGSAASTQGDVPGVAPNTQAACRRLRSRRRQGRIRLPRRCRLRRSFQSNKK